MALPRLGFINLLFFLVFASCQEKPATVNFNIKVKDNQGSAVDNAAVLFNGEEQGKTNTSGVFAKTFSLPQKTKVHVEVKKDSANYYFAPYYSTFDVAEQESQDISLNGTLYFVPKPTMEEQESLASEDKNSNSEKKEANPANANSQASAESTTAAEATLKEATEPAKTPVALNHIPKEPAQPEVPSKPQAAPKTLFTVHTYLGQTPVDNVEIYAGSEDAGQLRKVCTTNARGRCVIPFKNKPAVKLTFVAKKQGFQTATMKSLVSHKGTLRFNLIKGQTMDVFAVSKVFNFTRGLEGVEVYIQGNLEGVTDKFGHFSYLYTGKKGDLVEVTLKTSGHLPREYATDFIVSGPMTLVRYLAPEKAPSVKVSVLKAKTAGSLREANFSGKVDPLILRAARKTLFSTGPFQEVAYEDFEKAANKAGLTLEDMAQDGWFETDLKATIDAVLVPTVVLSRPITLELALTDSKGQVIAAAKEAIESLDDLTAMTQSMTTLSRRLVANFPFEGAVTDKKGDKLTLNLGKTGHGIKVGNEFDIYGMQTDKFGRKQSHEKIGRLKISQVNDWSSTAAVVNIQPRAVVAVGDLVTLRSRKEFAENSLQIKVMALVSQDSSEPVAQANVYLNDHWLGATDKNGNLYTDQGLTKESGILKVIKQGYRDFVQELNTANLKTLNVKLVRETAFLRVESEPVGATIKIDGRTIGKTPFSSPIPVPTGFVKLEVSGDASYKAFSTVLELDQGTLDLTGPRKIQLEKDVRAEAQALLDKGKVDRAIEELLTIAESHSDYLLANHEAGELYLTQLNKPAEAAKHFGLVTANPKVKSFNDKRFIGSHINEGIALFMTAEKLLTQDKEAAKAHYGKALEVLTKVGPHLRFVVKEQYPQAVHNVGFHKALAQHKLWELTKNPASLAQTQHAWREYLNTTSKNLPASGETKNYLDHAQVYYKQIEAQSTTGATMEKL